MLKIFGETVEITEAMECARGGDHRRLMLDARTDCLARALNPDTRYALCGRCAKALSLKI